MKKFYLIIVTTLSVNLSFSQIVGTWKLANQAGALAVGPTNTDFSWWSNSLADVATRACLFDDSITFDASGNVMMYMDGSTWLEPFQGQVPEGCGTPVSPHDGSSTSFTYVYDAPNFELTLNGVGAFLGLAKVINDAEMTDLTTVPSSIEYVVNFSSNDNTMTILIYSGVGWWRFVYNRTNLPDVPPPTPFNVTFRVDMSNYSGSTANGVYLNGDFNAWCGYCSPMTNSGNNVWEITAPILPGPINYLFTVDGWNSFEAFTSNLSCLDPIADEFFNRYQNVVADAILPTYCFNSCEACVGLSVNELFLHKITVHPNPANDVVTISTNSKHELIEIFNLSGKKILDVKASNSTKTEINVASIQAGTYLVRVLTDNGFITEKLLID